MEPQKPETNQAGLSSEPKTAHNFPCRQCGAQMTFKPGATSQVCEYCGFEQVIPKGEEEIEELDFQAYTNQAVQDSGTIAVTTTKCDVCAAESTIDPNVTSRNCPFCGSPQLRESHRQLIKPKSLLPFAVQKKEASKQFRKWISGLWFAPNKLKHVGDLKGGLNGMYVPYWTYDTYTTTFYRGRRGVAYYVSESYTTTENGRSVTRTRRVRKIRWYPASGSVFVNFDDVTVMASHSLPQSYADKLEPWDMENLVAYDPRYLSGFRAENYQIDLAQGFESAKLKMEPEIRRAIQRDIGGDEQLIDSMRTGYDKVTFKHILLPIWISAYQFQKKVFRILVNGRTGEVQGERPYSWYKIAFATLIVSVIGFGIYTLSRG